MENYYTIKRYIWVNKPKSTYYVAVLNNNNEWCIATNSPLKFKTCRDASKYWFNLSSRGCFGSDIWICGPRDGFHHITKGNKHD